ncbi:MAG: oligosaccharide flippase family protein [Bacteroidota bacterium]
MLKVLGKDFLIYGLSSSIGKFVALFLVPIYTRIFSPEDYGTIDLISTIVAVFTILGMLQLESAVSRYYYNEKDEVNRNKMVSTALWAILTFSLFLFLILFVFSDFLSNILFKSEKFSDIIIIACVAIPLNNLSSLFTVIVRFRKKALHYLLFQVAQIGISVGLTIFLVVYLHVGITGVFWGQLTGTAVSVIMMAIYLRKQLFFIWNSIELRKMLQFSLPLVPAVAGSWANSYISRFVMLGYLSFNEIGLYAVALKISSVFQLIGTALRMAWGPFMWETYENNPDHKNVFAKIQKDLSIFVLLTVILITLFSREIILIFTTVTYIDSARLIGPLSLSIAISTVIMQITSLGPAITKKTKYNTLIYFYSLIINIVSLFILVPQFGLLGVALSMLLGNLTFLIIGWYNSERLYYIGFEKLPMIINISVVFVVIVLNLIFDIPVLFKLLLALLAFIYIMNKYIAMIKIFSFKKVLRAK